MALTTFDWAHTRGFYGFSHGEYLERYMLIREIFFQHLGFFFRPWYLLVEGDLIRL